MLGTNIQCTQRTSVILSLSVTRQMNFSPAPNSTGLPQNERARKLLLVQGLRGMSRLKTSQFPSVDLQQPDTTHRARERGSGFRKMTCVRPKSQYNNNNNNNTNNTTTNNNESILYSVIIHKKGVTLL